MILEYIERSLDPRASTPRSLVGASVECTCGLQVREVRRLFIATRSRRTVGGRIFLAGIQGLPRRSSTYARDHATHDL